MHTRLRRSLSRSLICPPRPRATSSVTRFAQRRASSSTRFAQGLACSISKARRRRNSDAEPALFSQNTDFLIRTSCCAVVKSEFSVKLETSSAISGLATMFKQALSVLGGFAVLFASSAFAANVELRPDHPEKYVVQRGDTLWTIAAKFLKSPWLWPEIWQANPQVQNPHKIYPGDVLSLVYIDGRPTLIKLSPTARVTELPDEIAAIKMADIQQFVRKMAVLEPEDYKRMPYVVASEGAEPLGSDRELAYVRGIPADAKPGTVYSIVRPTLEYREIPPNYVWDGEKAKVIEDREWNANRRKTVGEATDLVWRNYAYWKDVEVLGHEVQEVGTMRLIKVGDPSTLLITSVGAEVRTGDMLMPFLGNIFDEKFYPRPPKQGVDNMRVMAVAQGIQFGAPTTVVSINKGVRDGVGTGQVFASWETGEKVVDRVAYPSDAPKSRWHRKKTKQVQLPDEFTGHVMIFKSFERISYGIVMDGVQPIEVGNFLRKPE
jgi:LysM repeat protein